MMPTVFAQPDAHISFCWGPNGLAELGPTVDAIVIVDVLRFTTCVSVACARGAAVLPYPWNDGSAADFATEQNAELAGRREDADSCWSLSPTDLIAIPSGTRLVLPSPNGSALAFQAASFGATVMAGGLRNAAAVGSAMAVYVSQRRRVAVIAAGERWNSTVHQSVDPLRPAVEDLCGAGAVIAYAMSASCPPIPWLSPEAHAAAAVFRDAASNMESFLFQSCSGRELVARGWEDDVRTAASINVDDCVPTLRRGAFVGA